MGCSPTVKPSVAAAAASIITPLRRAPETITFSEHVRFRGVIWPVEDRFQTSMVRVDAALLSVRYGGTVTNPTAVLDPANRMPRWFVALLGTK